MNDIIIRENFHKKHLRKYAEQKDVLVIDELGLNHGQCRADIAVINGKLIGYEIKSNEDTFYRLHGQIGFYSAIFDRVYIIVGDRHSDKAHSFVPQWWGIIESYKGQRGAIRFKTLRRATPNPCLDKIAIAQLLWRDEVLEILKKKNSLNMKKLRQPRSKLYKNLAEILDMNELKETVRKYLKNRKNWRCC